MSIPKRRPPLPASSAPSRQGHYFDPQPAVASKPRTVRLRLGEMDLELQTDRGVFGFRAVDLGTMVLLREVPPPPSSGDLLDLGCGYGPIAMTVALRSPDARVWAVDVNERAVELARANAVAVKAANLTACLPGAVPDDVSFDAIYSNPPVRVGKAPLHELLLQWLPRLKPEGSAYLVVQRNLGADSLATWLAGQGFRVDRIKSKKGFRVMEVKPPPY
ncbi:MAG TPA: methyltransferase [Candidatus Dormibacteraeota bacterium]|jgi:16S rRNA G1207 methylase RsmC